MSPMNTAKRLQILAQGFNPGCGVVTGRALNGHQTGIERLSQRNHVVRKIPPSSGATGEALRSRPRRRPSAFADVRAVERASLARPT